MLVKVIKDEVPYVGKRGETKELSDPEAKALIALGSVEEVEGPPGARKGRRVYKRRDMVAEEEPPFEMTPVARAKTPITAPKPLTPKPADK